jgi:hypothetical protein
MVWRSAVRYHDHARRGVGFGPRRSPATGTTLNIEERLSQRSARCGVARVRACLSGSAPQFIAGPSPEGAAASGRTNFFKV